MPEHAPATIRPQGLVAACAKDPQSLQHLELAIRRNGYDVVPVSTLDELQTVLLRETISAAVIDEPESADLIEQLDKEVRRAEKPTQFILLPSIGQRMAAPRSVSCEIVDPPLTPERIGRALFAAVGRAQLILENIQLRQKLEGRMFDGLVGVSQATRELRSEIHTAAEHDLPVLVVGESGCGKSEVARAIHLTRSGPSKPFLSLRCSLLTAAVIEKELYGDEQNPSRLAAAEGGTLVFEDVETLTLPQQGQLAEIILNNAFRHGQEFVELHTRIIATTSANLQQLVREEKFDARLYQALSRTKIQVARLSERMDDLPVLTEHFLQQCAVREGVPVRKLSDEALTALFNHNWPGNVRELENVISRATSIASGDTITVGEIQPWLETSEESAEAPGMTLREMERKLIEATFNRFGGNRELTAKALKIGIRTLSGKLREYGYPPRGGPGSNRKKDAA